MIEQFAYQEFSSVEIENLRTGLKKIELELNINPEKWKDFLEDPMSYLSEFNITLLESFQSNAELIISFNETAISVLIPSKMIFNKCLGCKIGIIILFYSLMGHVGYMINITIEMLRTVLDGLGKWLGGTSDDSDRLIKKLSALIDHLTISELALTICRQSGHCSYATKY